MAAVPWTPTPALRRAIAVSALALLAGVVLGRIELVLLAVPFVLGTAWSLAVRPAEVPPATLALTEPTSAEGGPVEARVAVHHDGPGQLLCVVSVQVPGWIRLRHGVGYYAALVRPPGVATVLLRGTAQRWGRYRFGPVSVQTVACEGLFSSRTDTLPPASLAVYPVSEPFDSATALPRAAGVSGIHRSRRLGEGGELAEVRPFQAGDRLRRIDWRVTLRTDEVHVAATLSERDADVLLLLDLRHEAGGSGGVGGAASVLDATVRAAAAIAEHYAQQGDRVALAEYGPALRRIPAGTGVRHYLAVLEWLVDTNFGPTGLGPAYHLLARGLQPARALVVVLTPLLDQDSANLLAVLARSGRSLVAVDTLPAGLQPPVGGIWAPAAVRLWRLERANTIGRLRGVGIPVEPWRGAGSLDLMLRQVDRRASSARRAS